VGLKHLGRRQAAIVGHQGVHAISFVVVGDRRIVRAPLDVEAPLGDLAVSGLGAGAPSLRLSSAMKGRSRRMPGGLIVGELRTPGRFGGAPGPQ
jgi:hypothetical protein